MRLSLYTIRDPKEHGQSKYFLNTTFLSRSKHYQHDIVSKNEKKNSIHTSDSNLLRSLLCSLVSSRNKSYTLLRGHTSLFMFLWTSWCCYEAMNVIWHRGLDSSRIGVYLKPLNYIKLLLNLHRQWPIW